MSTRKPKEPTTKAIAETLGVAGPDVLEKAQEVGKKFQPGQVVWTQPYIEGKVGVFIDKVAIEYFDPYKREYQVLIVKSDNPTYRVGGTGHFKEEELSDTQPTIAF